MFQRDGVSDEVRALRIELEEKTIQIDALSRFEYEFGLKVDQLINEKDTQINQLQAQVHELSCSPLKKPIRDDELLFLLRERENEVSVLEERVREVMRERANRPEAHSLTESIMDYERRVDTLRQELIGKDSEISELRGLVDGLQPVDKRGFSIVRDLISFEGEESFVEDTGMVDSLCGDLRAITRDIQDLREQYFALPKLVEGNESVVSICTQQVREFKRSAERYKRELDSLRKSISENNNGRIKLAVAGLDMMLAKSRLEEDKQFLFERLAESALADCPPVVDVPLRKPLVHMEDAATSARRSPRRLLLNEGISNPPPPRLGYVPGSEISTPPLPVSTKPRLGYGLASDISSPPLPALTQSRWGYVPGNDLSTPPLPLWTQPRVASEAISVPVRGESAAIPPQPVPGLSLDAIAKRLKEETSIRKRIEEENEFLRQARDNRLEVDQVRGELKSKDSELRNIRGKVLELKKDLQLLEHERETHESDKRKMQRTIDSLRTAANSSGNETTRLEGEIGRLQNDMNRLKSRPRIVDKKKPKSPLTMTRTDAVVFSHSAAIPAASDLTVRLHSQLVEAEEELALCQRQLRVDSQLELDLATLKASQLESEIVQLRAENDDLKFQLRQSRPGTVVEVDLQLSEDRLAAVIRESQLRSVEIVRLKSKMLELEFDKTDLLRRCERAQEECNIFKSNTLALRMKPQPLDNGEMESLRSQNKQLEKEVDALRNEGVSRLSDHSKEIDALRNQREQDKAAITEAERVLGLVEQSEAKYLKVAKENSKLRKEIAALNDDTFWNDLETLQNNHRDSLDLLSAMEPLIKDKSLRDRIRQLTAS